MIPDEAVEAATRALSGYSPEQYERWRYTSRGQRWHDMAYAALDAALPPIREQIAREVVDWARDGRFTPWGDEEGEALELAARIARGGVS